MTATEWYTAKRKEYFARYGRQWKHLIIYGDRQNSEASETAMRSGIECRNVGAYGPNEVEMVTNAIMIRDYMKSRRNSAKENEDDR